MFSPAFLELFFKEPKPKARPSQVVESACARMYTATKVYREHIELGNNGTLYAFPYSNQFKQGVLLRDGPSKESNMPLSKVDQEYVDSFYDVCMATIEKHNLARRKEKERAALAHINSALPEAYRKKL